MSGGLMHTCGLEVAALQDFKFYWLGLLKHICELLPSPERWDIVGYWLTLLKVAIVAKRLMRKGKPFRGETRRKIL
jgi:hypothetical protein